MKVRIDTVQTSDVGRRIIADGERLDQIGYELQHVISSLDTWAWDGVSRSRAEPLLGQARSASLRLAQALEKLGHTLVKAAETFEEIDRNVVKSRKPPPTIPSDWLPGHRPPQDWGLVLGMVIGVVDKGTRQFVDHYLGPDLEGREEFISIQFERGATIPLGELGLPFSGYLSGEEGLTIQRNDDGTYSVIIGHAGGVGVDYHFTDEIGARVGLRGEEGFEFQFNPGVPGDMSKMALLLTTLGGKTMLATLGQSQLGQMAEKVTLARLKDNMTSMSKAVGIEAQMEAGVDGFVEAEIEGAVMVGQKTCRENLQDTSWESVQSFKFETGAEVDIGKNIGISGEVSQELTFNRVFDAETGQTSTEVVLELQASAGGQLKPEDLKSLLPEGVDAGMDFDIESGVKITYTTNESIESAMDAAQKGNLASVIQNSTPPYELETIHAEVQSIGGEIKETLTPGQTVGAELEIEISRGYTSTTEIP